MYYCSCKKVFTDVVLRRFVFLSNFFGVNIVAKSANGMEHERRFFPNLKDWIFDSTFFEETFILQGYLEDFLRIRVRKETDPFGVIKYTQTRKSKNGISRPENEEVISEDAFNQSWKEVKCLLEKSRYFIPLDSEGLQFAEINIFHGSLRGYVQIEVKFDSHEEAVAFNPPGWFGKEVTDDSRHGNYSLAKNGCQELIS